jgi:hypothetical protein
MRKMKVASGAEGSGSATCTGIAQAWAPGAGRGDARHRLGGRAVACSGSGVNLAGSNPIPDPASQRCRHFYSRRRPPSCPRTAGLSPPCAQPAAFMMAGPRARTLAPSSAIGMQKKTPQNAVRRASDLNRAENWPSIAGSCLLSVEPFGAPLRPDPSNGVRLVAPISCPHC